MPGTTVIVVPAGSTCTPFAVTPLHNVCAGPAVLGGTVLLETASNNQGPWLAWGAGSSGAADSVRSTVNAWVRVTATTQAAIVFVSDMGGANTPAFTALANMNGTIATPSSTAIQKLFSVRVPPNFLPPNFRCQVSGSVNLTNNVNVKTLTCLLNGVAGTSFFTSPSLASNANYNFVAAFVGQGAGALKGVGAGATGGLGLSTTAFTTLAYDFINNELEIVIAATKATGTDTFTLEACTIQLF